MKSETDEFWDYRALTEPDDAKVNIADTVQRDLELDFVLKHVPVDAKILEVGCGNGYLTERLLTGRSGHVDSFDFSENMIARARATVGQAFNRFFHGSVLEPGTCEAGHYDVAICVRVLINLRNLGEQSLAIANIASWLRPGGKLILVEGFKDGFDALNHVRSRCDMPNLEPASINFYSWRHELWPAIDARFECVDEFHTGMFDFLTRVVYPRLERPDDFHHRIAAVARQFNPDTFGPLARVNGFALIKR